MNLSINLSSIARARDIFGKMPDRLQGRLRTANIQSQAELLKEIKDRVPVLSGTLRRSWNASAPKPVAGGGAGYTGTVGSNLDYARYQDEGFHGTEFVSPSRPRTQAFGRETKPYFVSPFTRNVSYEGKNYIKPAVVAALPAIQQHHVDAVRAAVEQTDREGF